MEAGGPVARVQERTDKARGVGTVGRVPGNTQEAAKAEGEGGVGVCSDVSRLSHWQMVVIFQETGNAGLGARGNSHVSGRYLRAILEGKQMIIGSTGENIPAGGAYLSVSGCELSRLSGKFQDKIPRQESQHSNHFFFLFFFLYEFQIRK